MKFDKKEVYKHREETIEFAKKLDTKKVSAWLLNIGYYPEAYVLPPFFTVSNFIVDEYFFKKKWNRSNRKYSLDKLHESSLINISYPSDGFTSRKFSIVDPRHYHDLSRLIGDNFDRFLRSYKAKRIFSFTFPVPISTKMPGEISEKRSERQIYEYIDAAEKKLLIDAASYKFVVIADIKQFYPSIYTHSISWAIHTKSTIKSKKGNETNLRLIGNHLDKLIQYSNDRKTNGIPIGLAVSDVISEWLLNFVDNEVSKKLPGRSFGIRFKDDYRIVCDSEDEGMKIISILQQKLRDYDLNLSEEKTQIMTMPDGLYRPWMVEYDHFVETLLGGLGKNENISFKKYLILQRKIFEMNKQYSAKCITEKFLARLVNDDYNISVSINTLTQKRMFVSNMVRLVGQKPKVIGQVLGLIESILDDELRPFAQESIDEIWISNKDNEFILCWLYYFNFKNNFASGAVSNEMQLLNSLKHNSQKFYTTKGVNLSLITKLEDVTISINEHVSLFRDEKLS